MAQRRSTLKHRWVVKGTKKDTKTSRAVDSGFCPEKFLKEWEPVPDDTNDTNADYYFNSYAHFGIHEDMLKDNVRTGSYMKAILGSRKIFEGKTVLDVGSGTGILCLFAAKAGAKRCFGIECSDIVDFATGIARDNGYGEVITYVRGRVEEVELPVDNVDVIVSEWMGYFLIYESMLDSVIFARDKWLSTGGCMFPDHARLHMAAIEDADYKEEKIGFWNHVCGFDFSPMQQMVMQEPISDTVDEAAIATSACCILEIDLHTVGKEDLDFVAPFRLEVSRKDFLHAMVMWFDVSFRASTENVVLCTAPGKACTHWKQTVLYFDGSIVAQKSDVLTGTIGVRKSRLNPRDLDVKLAYEFEGHLSQPPRTQFYRLR